MTDLSAFTSEGTTVRVAVIGGQPWYLLPDLCDALDLGPTASAAVHLAPEARTTVRGTGEAGPVPAVTEQGMIALALRAESLTGHRNRRWLLDQVQPAARQIVSLGGTTGLTITTTATPEGITGLDTPQQGAPLRIIAQGPEDPPAPLLALPAPELQTRPVESTGSVLPTPSAGLMPFSFGDRPVRAITRDGAPWVVLADVCRVLEIGNTADAAPGCRGEGCR